VLLIWVPGSRPICSPRPHSLSFSTYKTGSDRVRNEWAPTPSKLHSLSFIDDRLPPFELGLRRGGSWSSSRWWSTGALLFLPRQKIHDRCSRSYHQRLGRRPRCPPRRELRSAKRMNHLPPSIAMASKEKFWKICGFPISTNTTDAEPALTAPAPVKSIDSQT